MKKIKTTQFKSLLVIGIAVTLFSFDVPKNWFKAGSNPDSYAMGIDKGAGLNGKNAAIIQSTEKKLNGYGTLMQNSLPDKYLGKRVRMTGYLKTKEVAGWAGLWFRIDQKTSSIPLGFDNMYDGKNNRAIKGTTNWAKYEIVLDVPINASNLAYGALLDGTGTVWFDNLNFEVVDNSVPTTGQQNISLMPESNKEPVNLDFEN